jgi:hypothetical protein
MLVTWRKSQGRADADPANRTWLETGTKERDCRSYIYLVSPMAFTASCQRPTCRPRLRCSFPQSECWIFAPCSAGECETRC